MSILICKPDFRGVVNVSEHCADGDDRINQFIQESQDTDLPGLLGFCLLEELIDNPEIEPYKTLLNGGSYLVEGKKRSHKGIKRVLIHYSWAAYVYRGGFVDTPFSFVQKTSQDSIPVAIGELRNLHDEHRKLAYKYWTMTYDYLCNNKDLFACFDDCDCPSACDGCGDENCDTCKGKLPYGTRKYRLKVIKK